MGEGAGGARKETLEEEGVLEEEDQKDKKRGWYHNLTPWDMCYIGLETDQW